MTDSDIASYLIRLGDEILQYKEQLFDISWHMRGGVTMHELLHVYSNDDIEILSKLIAEHITLTKETRMPLL